MSTTRSVAEVLREHVTLAVEGIDRMYDSGGANQLITASKPPSVSPLEAAVTVNRPVLISEK